MENKVDYTRVLNWFCSLPFARRFRIANEFYRDVESIGIDCFEEWLAINYPITISTETRIITSPQ